MQNKLTNYTVTKPYRLIGKDGKAYLSHKKGQLGGHSRLKIYGKLDCPSALRHIAAGRYIKHRVFFKDEETALAAGYRPCGVCMKEHYKLWKEGRIMSHGIYVTPILNESSICSVQIGNGDSKILSCENFHGTSIPNYLKDGIENYQMKIEGGNCVITLTAEQGQWGYTVVWDYTQDKLVHLTNTPFASFATVLDSKVVVVYLVQYWGHPADLWYSAAPLELVDPNYEPEMFPLDMALDDSVKDPANFFADFKVCQKDRKVFFRTGKQEVCVDKLPDDTTFNTD